MAARVGGEPGSRGGARRRRGAQQNVSRRDHRLPLRGEALRGRDGAPDGGRRPAAAVAGLVERFDNEFLSDSSAK